MMLPVLSRRHKPLVVPTSVPAVASASINAAGTTLSVVFDQAVSGEIGISVVGTYGTRSGEYVSGSGTANYSFTTSKIISGETLTLSYAPGTIIAVDDLAPMEAFSGVSVTNNSTVTATTIDQTWLDANRHASDTHSGTPTSSTGWKLSSANAVYRLTLDVSSEQTAFVAAANNITLLLNGHTVTYDTKGTIADQPTFEGYNASQTAAMLRFETEGGGGATTALGWDLGSSGFTRIEKDQYGMLGTHILKNAAVSTTALTILSSPIDIPRKGAQYYGYVLPYSNYDTVINCYIVNVADTVTYGTATASNTPNRQCLARTTWDCPSDGPDQVRLKIVVSRASGTDTVRLCNAGLRLSMVHGAWSASSTTNAPQYMIDRWTGTDLTKGTGFTLCGAGTLEQSGVSWFSAAIYARAVISQRIENCTLRTKGSCCQLFQGLYAASTTIRKVTGKSQYELIERRQSTDGLFNLGSPGNFISICQCTLEAGTVCHIPINVATSGGTRPKPIIIDDNHLVWTQLAADGYGVVINRMEDVSIRRNYIHPDNGRGILIDGYSSSGSINVAIEDNDVVCQEKAVLEYASRAGGSGAALECTGLRVRQFGGPGTPDAIHHKLLIRNNTFRVQTFAGTDPASPSYPTTTEAWDGQVKCVAITTVAGDHSALFTGDDYWMKFENNTFDAVCEVDAGVTGGTRAWSFLFNAVDGTLPLTFSGNTLKGNASLFAFGNMPDGYDGLSQNITLDTSTLIKDTEWDTGVPFNCVTVDGNSTTSNVKIVSSTFGSGVSKDVKWGWYAGADSGSNIGFGYRLTVHVTNTGSPASGATVTITDDASATVFSGTTDASGNCVAALTTEKHTWNGSSNAVTNPGPFLVSVSHGGDSDSNTIDLTQDDTISFAL